MLKKIKNILINVFGDGFFGLERDNTTQIDISKDNKKKPVETSVCYGVSYSYPQQNSCMGVSIGSCASFSSGQHNVAIGHQSGGVNSGSGLYTHFEERILE